MKKIALSLAIILLLGLTLPALASPDADASGTPERLRERHELARRTLERLETLDASAGEAALTAAAEEEGVTVSVTARLPSGATAAEGDYAYVELYAPAEISAAGRVLKEAAHFQSQRANFPKGGTASTILFEDVPSGDYILATYTGRMSGGKILNGGELYYNSRGYLSSNQYAVSPFTVSHETNLSKAIVLPAAESSISGVLTFSSPLARDTEFYLYCDEQGPFREYYHVYFTGKKDATSVPFSIGVTSGCYALQFEAGGSYYYLDYNGNLTENYNYYKNYYCNVKAGERVSGLSVNGDMLLSGTQSAETVNAEISVTLPGAFAGEREFALCAVYKDSGYLNWRAAYETVTAGQTSFSQTLALEKNREYALGYRDTTDCRSIYGPDSAKDMRYVSKNGGVTALYENAKKFRFTSDASVSIEEPACGRVTGRLSRNGFNPNADACAYAYALFPDGERYCARVPLGGAASADFVIYVPADRDGQTFQLSAVMARPASNCPIEASASKPLPLTFSGDVSAGTVSVSGDYRNIFGTISLPDGVKAPVGGQAVRMEAQYDSDDVYYVIPAGQNSAVFSFDAYRRKDYSDESLGACLEGRLSGVYPEIRQSQRFNDDAKETSRAAWYENRAVAFPAAAVISGSVSFPSGTKNVGATMELSAYNSAYNIYANTFASILKGRNSTSYAFTVPKGKLSDFQLTARSSTDGRAADDTLSMDRDWKAAKDWAEGPTVTENRSKADFTLEIFDAAKPSVSFQSEDVLSDLRQSGSVYAVCAGPTGKTAVAIGAIYDEQGRFLDAAMQPYVELRRSGDSVYLRFDGGGNADAASVRVCLLDYETYAPLATTYATATVSAAS